MVETLIRQVVVAITIGSFLFLLRAFARSIEQERRKNDPLRKGFGLSFTLLSMFLAVWFGHGLAQWQEYNSQQDEHGQPAEIGGFVDNFAQATLEDWQSEYLQVLVFVVLAGLYIHRGSAESKDGEEEIKAMLRRIERKLDEKEKATC